MKAMTRKQKAAAAARKEDPRLEGLLRAVVAAAETMDAETRALEQGGSELSGWAERKREAEAAIREAGRAAVDAGLSIAPGSPDAASVEAALASLRTSVEANLLALQGTAEAVGKVVSALKRASAGNAGEGMYSRAASRVELAPRRGFGTAV